MWSTVMATRWSSSASRSSVARSRGATDRSKGRSESSRARRSASASRVAAGSPRRSRCTRRTAGSAATRSAGRPSCDSKLERSGSWRRAIALSARSSASACRGPRSRSGNGMCRPVPAPRRSMTHRRCCAKDGAGPARASSAVDGAVGMRGHSTARPQIVRSVATARCAEALLDSGPSPSHAVPGAHVAAASLTQSGAGVLVEDPDVKAPGFPDRMRALLERHRFALLRGGLPTLQDAIDAMRRLGPLNEAQARREGALIIEAGADEEVFRSHGALPLHKDGLLTGFDVAIVGIYCVQFRDVVGGRTLVSDVHAALEEVPAADVELLRRQGLDGLAVDNTGHYRSDFASDWHHFPAFRTRPGNETRLSLGLPHAPGERESWRVRVAGVSPEESARVLGALRRAFLDERYLYVHDWREGDLLLMDNDVVMHGREAFEATSRRLANIQVLAG